MELNEYQQRAMQTCMPSCSNVTYMLLNLVGEMGEFSSKVAKVIRHGDAVINHNDLILDEQSIDVDAFIEGLKAEAGDILWQLSGLCYNLGWALEDVATANLVKLASRKQRGVIDGNGDER